MANLKNGSTVGGRVIESQQGAQLKSDKAYTDAKSYVDAHIGKGGAVHAEATQSSAGFISAGDKTKLDGITSGSTKVEDSTTNGNIKINGTESVVYTHPSTHAATMITQDTNNRFVSDAEKATWNAKLSTTDNAASASKLQTARTISLTGDVTGSVTFDGTANASITAAYKNSGVTAGTYKSVTVDAKGNVTAGTNPTTLSGYGITDAATSNHAHSIASSAITDVVVTTPTDNEVLAYDTSTAKWINQTAAEAGLLTTSGTAAAAAKWATSRTITLAGDTTGSVSLDGSANVTLTVAIADDSHNHIIANIDGLQTALDSKSATSHTHALTNLTDVTVTSPASGHTLRYSGSAWVNTFPTLNDNSDITLTSAASGHILQHDGTKWVNRTLATAGIAAASHGNHVPTTQTANNAIFLRNDNTWQTVTPANIGAAASSVTLTGGTGIVTSIGNLTTNRTISLDTTYTDGRYLNKSGDSFDGKITATTRQAGIYGTYDSTKIDHVWSMGTGYVIEAAGANFGNLYGIAYKHTNNTTGGTMAGGHQIVFTSNGTPGVALGLAGNIWTSGTIYEGGQTLSSRYASSSHNHNGTYVYGSVRVTVASTAPSSPAVGDLWFW